VTRAFFCSALLMFSVALWAGTQVFTDCKQCPEMVTVPVGEYLIGSTKEQTDRLKVPGKTGNRERPQHLVAIAYPFAISRHQVTRGEFRRFLKDSGRTMPAGCFAWRIKPGGWQFHEERSWQNPGFPQQDNHPVVCVSWQDAQAYTAWLSDLSGQHYRLTTEAEWEYAARAGSETARYWGDATASACHYANVYDESAMAASENEQSSGAGFAFRCDDGYAYTSPSGSFNPNAFGLYDVLGNVWEWTEDCFNWTYEGAPADGRAWVGGVCAERVVRGGSAMNDPQSMRVSERGKNGAADRYNVLGFRVARDVSVRSK
jgi:sulfatase modifying factor 1